ncbi:MAG: DNA adenine methylase [Promethearchaeota archaeon]
MLLESRLTIASYPGGKSDKKKHQPLFQAVPLNISYLVEPFAGLANFFLVVSPRVKQVWLNDKDPEVFALLKCIKEPDLLDKLIEYIHSINPVERDEYYQWKKSNPRELLEQAVRRLVILNCSPNGAGGGYSNLKAHRKWYTNKPKAWKQIHAIFAEKKVEITNWDYLEVFKSLNDFKDKEAIFLYLDPPYFDVAQRGSLYGRGFNTIDWEELKTLLRDLPSHWILSNRDIKDMRDLFSEPEFHILRYNTYNDMNNTQNKNPELIVSNKPLQFKENKIRALDKFLKADHQN